MEKVKSLNVNDKRRLYLVWEIPISPSRGLINLRAICAKSSLANLYRTMLERDLLSVAKGDATIFIEESLLNHLYAHGMLSVIIENIKQKG